MFEIFQKEKEDGLEAVLANVSIAYTLELNLLKEETLAETYKWATTAAYKQPDLFYMDSILATLGWNLNDDIFLRSEVVAAKDTPVDKPFNMMHNQEEIIGHMTASRLLNSDYAAAGDAEFEHIAVSSVIYRAWREEKKKEEVEKTIAEILEGKWKVSMECLFNKFDYGVITPEGKQLVIARTPETSYLTKYLRAYKGPGVFNNNRIGRVLRNITFCGKGLVDNPGNPYSIIFNKSEKFFEAKASENKEFVMNELELAKAELDKTRAELASAKAEAQKAAEAKNQAAIAELNDKIKEKDATIASLREDVTKISTNLETAKANYDALELLKTQAAKNYEEAKAELDKIKAEAVVLARKTALAKVIAEDKIDETLAKWSKASDELFNEFVSTLAEFKPFEKKKDEGKEDEKKKEDEAKAAEQVKADLAKAELEKTVNEQALASKNNDDDLKAVVDFMTKNSINKSLI